MAPSTTIQLQRPTKERLEALKLPGLTFDDVLNFLLDRVPPDEIERLYTQWQEAAMDRLRRHPDVRPWPLPPRQS